MKYCPACKIDLLDTAKFCKTCGGPAVEKAAETQPVVERAAETKRIADPAPTAQTELLCPGCAARVQPSWRACTRCGYQLQAAQPPAHTAAQGSSVICRVCGKANRAGVRFCDGCGNIIESQPAVEGSRPIAGSEFGAQMAPAPFDPDATRRSVFDSGAGAAPAATQCSKCGAMIRAGLRFCEVCGTPAGYMEEPRQPGRYKWLIATAIVIVVLGAAAAGYYFWGVKLTIVVSADPPGMAQVLVDGEPMGQTDGRMTINHVLRGEHRIEIRRDGFDSYTTNVNLGLLDFAKSVEASLKLTVYTLTITGAPNDSAVRILLDDKQTGPKPAGQWDRDKNGFVVKDLPGNRQYTLIVRREGYREFKRDITLARDESIKTEWTISAAGDWGGSYQESNLTDAPVYVQFNLKLADSGTPTASRAEFTGTLEEAFPTGTYRIEDGLINPRDRLISFKITKAGITINFTGTLEMDLRQAKGRWYPSGPGLGGDWSMTRSPTPGR